VLPAVQLKVDNLYTRLRPQEVCPEIGIYARVSTTDQDPQRQLDELREFAEDTYNQPAIHAYADIISGTETVRGEEYQRLRSDVEDGDLYTIIVHELSRLSRLGAGEIHEFLEFCLSHETGIQDLEVGLEISLKDDIVDRAVRQPIAGLMGDLARVEHKQKLRRIQSGIDAAKVAGRWTGRPPTGFDVEDGYLQVNADEFLTIRRALERVEQGYTYAEAATTEHLLPSQRCGRSTTTVVTSISTPKLKTSGSKPPLKNSNRLRNQISPLIQVSPSRQFGVLFAMRSDAIKSSYIIRQCRKRPSSLTS